MEKPARKNLDSYPQVNNAPFFSVVIPTFNRSKTILRALDSLIAQTEQDWEAIIIDDGSTDDTFDLLVPYIETYPHIKYIFHSNQGAAKAKNTGIFVASGIFVTFLDSDDEFHPSHLAIRKNHLLKNPTLNFLHGGVTVSGNQSMPDKYDLKKIVNVLDCIIGGTFVVERNAILKLEGFRDIRLSEDSDLYERAIEGKLCIEKIEAPTYVYHRDSLVSLTHEWIQSSN